MDAYLIERLGDVTGTLPTGTVIIPVDSSYVNDDTSISTVVAAQLDSPQVIDIYNNLHSTLQNKFYFDFSFAYQKENNNIYTYVNVLKTLFDIDYFDGDQTAFLEKITNLLNLFNIKAPLTFLDFVGSDKGVWPLSFSLGDTDTFTRKNDFLRNIVKRAALMHHWRGTLKGYKLPVKMIQRIGGIHLGSIKRPDTLSPMTDRKFRFMGNINFFSPVLSGGIYYPDSGNIDGYTNFSQIPLEFIKYDGEVVYDELAQSGLFKYSYDTVLPITLRDKQLFIEMSLDRLNYDGPTLYLLRNEFLKAIQTLESGMERVNDNVNIGAQITLVTDTSEYFDKYSGATSDYTHENIRAKFQSYPGIPTAGISLTSSILAKFHSIKSDTTVMYNDMGTFNGAMTNITTDGVTNPDFVGIVCDGISSNIAIPQVGGIFDGLGNTLNFSVSFWIKTTLNTGIIMQQATTDNTTFIASIGHITDGKIDFGYSSNGTTIAYVSSIGSVINDDEWHHIVFVFTTSESIKIYQDGIIVATGIDSIPAQLKNNTEDVLIAYDGSDYYALSFAELLIYKSSLSSSEILYLYDNPKGTPILFDTNTYSYIKLGTGGRDADTQIFNSITDPTHIHTRPVDLYNPSISIAIVDEEVLTSSTESIVTAVFHPREIKAQDSYQWIYLNGNPVDNTIYHNYIVPTYETYTSYISGYNRDIDKGSIGVNLYIDTNMPTLRITSTSEVVLSDFVQKTENVWVFSVLTCPNSSTLSFDYTKDGNTYTTGSLDANNIPDMVTKILGATLTDFTFMVSGVDVWAVWGVPNIHHKVSIKETYDAVKNIYFPSSEVYTFQAYAPVLGGNSNITFTALDSSDNKYTYLYRISVPPALPSGVYITIEDIRIPIKVTDTYEDIVTKLSRVSTSKWNIRWKLQSSIYYVYFEFKEPYTLIPGNLMFVGYMEDASYEDMSLSPYMPTLEKNTLLFQPLYVSDEYPSLSYGVICDYRNNTGSYTNIIDSSYFQLSGTGIGIVEGSSQFISGLDSFAFDGTTSYLKTSEALEVSKFDEVTLALAYNTKGNTLIKSILATNKTGDIESEGWGVYLTSDGDDKHLDFYYTVSSSIVGHWIVYDIPSDGLFHRLNFGWNIKDDKYVVFCYIDGTRYYPYRSLISGILTSVDTKPVFFGGRTGSLTYSHLFNGEMSDIKIWNRLLSLAEMSIEKISVMGRRTPLLDFYGNQKYIHIDYQNGGIGLRLQYNPYGALNNIHGNSIDVSKENIHMDVSYTLLKSVKPEKYTELGLYNNMDIMLAYATFPPISLDLSQFHLGVNLVLVED